MTSRYEEVRARSVDDPEGFWAEAADEIHWYKKWHKVFDDSNKPFYRWFVGGEVNTCYNAVDRHVENGRADQVALIYDSPVTERFSPSPSARFGNKSRSVRAPSPRSASRRVTESSSTCR